MLYVVEIIRRPPGAMTKVMGEIRDCLDTHRVEPLAFRCSTNSESVMFRLEFSRENDAKTCGEALGGRFVAVGEAS